MSIYIDEKIKLLIDCSERHVDLSKSLISSCALKRFFQVSSLQTLFLSWNNIDDAWIIDAFSENTTLTSLSLSFNNIKKRGAMFIAEILKTNSTLTNLDLSNNPIESKGILAISDALKSNMTLKYLNVKDVGVIDNVDVKIIFRCLDENYFIRYFNMQNWCHALMERNKRIQDQAKSKMKVMVVCFPEICNLRLFCLLFNKN